MKDIPLFETSGGLCSLFLSQIPLKKTAWIMIHGDNLDMLPALLNEAGSFCRFCGAEQVYAGWQQSGDLPLFPAYDIICMQAEKKRLSAASGRLILQRVSEQQTAEYASFYNRIFSAVVHARLYAGLQTVRLSDQNPGFWVIYGNCRVGIGQLAENELLALGLIPEYRGRGLGRDLVCLLASQCPGPTVLIRTESTNLSACRLYQSLGFVPLETQERWFRLYPSEEPV